MSQKNKRIPLKIGYNSGCDIMFTKVKYLLNGSTDLYTVRKRARARLRIACASTYTDLYKNLFGSASVEDIFNFL